ncbi:Serine/threonine-protein kinase srk1 [Spathaspora sp. JA1]|nr:Serine/threonine-protein kinase srk1 [Spathaspora sp. JA1]
MSTAVTSFTEVSNLTPSAHYKSNSSSCFTFDQELHDIYPDLPSQYKLVCSLGEGAFSTVYKAIDTSQEDLVVAIKIIKKANLSSKQFHNIKNEIAIMKRINNHPNLLKLLDSIDSKDHCFLILEYCNGGEIFNKIIEYTYFSESLSRHVFKQLLSAIDHLHKLNIVHRDIKPENLLFKKIPYFERSEEEFKNSLRTSDDEVKLDEGEFKLHIGGGTIGLIKLADFGLAKQLIVDENEENEEMRHMYLKTPCGTAGYTAPEVITCNARQHFLKRSKNYYSKSVDIWSLGCFLYTILCGFPPFYDDDANSLTIKILRGDFVFLQPWWDEISANAKDLISRMLTINPEQRITIDEIWNHPWLQHEKDEITQEQLQEQPEATYYFTNEPCNYQVYDAEVNESPLSVPTISNQPLKSPRAQAIKKVFDNHILLDDDYKDNELVHVEDVEDDEEDSSPGPDDCSRGYVRTPYPTNEKKDSMFAEDDFDYEIEELGDVLTSLQVQSLSPKLRLKNAGSAPMFAESYLEDEIPDEYLSSNNSSSEIDSAELDYQTRSSSIISGINGEYKFTLNLNDSNLVTRRRSSSKKKSVSSNCSINMGINESTECA